MFSVDLTALVNGIFDYATIAVSAMLPVIGLSSGIKMGLDLMGRIERIFARAV